MTTKIHTSPKNDILAQKKLAAFEADLARGKSPAQSVKISALLDDVLNDYTINKKRSIVMVKIRVEKHLRPWFGEMRSDKLHADDWREYVVHRQTEAATNNTINLERATLRFGYGLALKAQRIDAVPYLPRLKNSARAPLFIDRKEMEALCRHLPEYLANVVRFAFWTGWRLGEIRGLQWRHIDFVRGEIRLDTSKNEDGRVFPMTSELRTLLETLAEANKAAASDTAKAESRSVHRAHVPTLTPHVFVLRGQPIGWIYASWKKAVKAIGKPGLQFRHLRNSAIIEMDQRGIPRTVIMELVGHRSVEIFEHYRRCTPADLTRAKELMEITQSVRFKAGNTTEG